MSRVTLTVGIGICGALLTACGQAPAGAPSTTNPPALASLPSQAPVTLSASCELGWVPNGGDGFSYNTRANASNPWADSGAEIRVINNSGHAVTVNGVSIQISDVQGDVIGTHYATPNDAPRFLAPNESDSWTVDFVNMDSHITVSLKTYLHATCEVTEWN
jgi:P pilus assembly chaperone PapD